MKKTPETTEELRKKLHDSIDKMIDSNGGPIKRCTYYHSGATFIETNYGGFMIRLVPYKPSKITLDELS